MKSEILAQKILDIAKMMTAESAEEKDSGDREELTKKEKENLESGVSIMQGEMAKECQDIIDMINSIKEKIDIIVNKYAPADDLSESGVKIRDRQYYCSTSLGNFQHQFEKLSLLKID